MSGVMSKNHTNLRPKISIVSTRGAANTWPTSQSANWLARATANTKPDPLDKNSYFHTYDYVRDEYNRVFNGRDNKFCPELYDVRVATKPIRKYNKTQQKLEFPDITNKLEFVFRNNGLNGTAFHEFLTLMTKVIPRHSKANPNTTVRWYLIKEPYAQLFTYGVIFANNKDIEKFRNSLSPDMYSVLEVLPEKYCSRCYNSGHHRKGCTDHCNYCRGPHDYRECPNIPKSLQEKSKKDFKPVKPFKELAPCTQKYYRKMDKLGLSRDPPYAIDYLRIKPEGQYNVCAIDCELADGYYHPLAVRVSIQADVKTVGKQLIYTAIINNCEHLYDNKPALNGTNVNDIIQYGRDPMRVRQEVLEILKGKKVFVFDGRPDFEGLDITTKNITDNNIQVIDMKLMGRFQDNNGFNTQSTVKLLELYYCYGQLTRKAATIQEIDNKVRLLPAHNCQLDAKATLEIGLKMSDISKFITFNAGNIGFKGLTPGLDRQWDYDSIKSFFQTEETNGHIVNNKYAQRFRESVGIYDKNKIFKKMKNN